MFSNNYAQTKSRHATFLFTGSQGNGGISPSLCPRVAFLPVPGPERKGFSWSSADSKYTSRICVAFKSRQDSEWRNKQETGNLGLEPPSFVFWFPSPICQLTFTFESSSSCYQHSTVFVGCIQWQERMEYAYYSTVTGMWASPISGLLNMHCWKQRLSGGHSHKNLQWTLQHFIMKASYLWNMVSQGHRKSAANKNKQLSSNSNKWPRNEVKWANHLIPKHRHWQQEEERASKQGKAPGPLKPGKPLPIKKWVSQVVFSIDEKMDDGLFSFSLHMA